MRRCVVSDGESIAICLVLILSGWFFVWMARVIFF